MTAFKFRKTFLPLALGLLILGACSDDDNECRDLAEYDLTIQNKTAEAFDVHINPGPGNDFYHAGHVAALQKTIIHELDIGIDYLVHLTDVNAPAESVIHEKTISSSGEDVTWTLAWEEVDLDLAPGGSQMLAIDFNGGQGLALGVLKTIGKDWAAENMFFRRQGDGSWLPDDPDNIPASILFLDLALDASGRPVLTGIQDVSPSSVLLDFRGSVPEYFTNTTRGLLAVDAGESFMVAGGRAMGGDLWTSTAANVWNIDDVTPPLTGTNDSGFRDVDVRGDSAVACGFDDGADILQVILTRTATSEWTKISTAGPGTRTFYCVALGDNGTIFVGGIEGAGGLSPKAFLTQRRSDGQWAELILPDPEILHGVNDILVASDGSIYLACMGEGDQTQANLIRAFAGGVQKEITAFPGGLNQLGEAENGDIFAVGFRRDQRTGEETGVMLRKNH